MHKKCIRNAWEMHEMHKKCKINARKNAQEMNKKYLVTTKEMQNKIILNQYNICQDMKKLYIYIYNLLTTVHHIMTLLHL